ncbi:MBL fold metallo-hydrolase [Aureimonas glaciei]|uniref:MBL fold metallo-hydrolase n=1 Tax=Aureimonas glaciei TaxID=1776957 RepID=A0A916Y8Y3_9HYPH|nr:MBL fold metallo-hydrolase [Aureimonas glaciei]GGD35206.1 MBL fold metallo-hydrolase [Aureimonas glaciei]
MTDPVVTQDSGDLNRRGAMKLAVGTAAAGLLFPTLAQAQSTTAPAAAEVPAPTPSPLPQTPGWRSVMIGEARVTMVLDGIRPGDGPHPTFGENQSAETVAELMRDNLLPETRFANGFIPVIVEIAEQRVLFDTGFGPGGRENGMGQLAERMADAGYAPEDIDIVVLTHMHGDHIGGLMGEDGPAFANARYVAGQVEYDFWTSDEAKSGARAGNAELVAKNVVPLKYKITFVGEGAEVVPGIVAHEAFGHSPGHLVFTVTSGDQTLWLTADTANHFVASLQKPDWEVRFDMDKAAAIATRRKIFDKIAADRVPFIGYHMPFPGIGYVQTIEGGYRFVPLTYQLDV